MNDKKLTVINNKRNKRVTIVKNSLKFLSWNIQAPSTTEGNKFQIKEFKDVLQTRDFICLQETRRDVHLTGYRAECSNHKDNKCGGVAILVKNEYRDGVEFIKDKNFTDYIVCRLKKTFFQQNDDIYLVNVYARPHNSNELTTTDKGRDILSKIEGIVNDLRQKGEVILCGDFNARIAKLTGLLEDDNNKFLPMPDDYEPDADKPRNSQDTSTNSYCKQFINLVSNNQLYILNGRTLGDFSGQFTSIQPKGCSVIDYFAVSPKLKNSVNFMKVQNLTMYSDHRPLTMELRCPPISLDPSKPLQDEYQKAPPRFIFNEVNKSSFIEALSAETATEALNELNRSLESLNHTTTPHTVNITLKTVNDTFTEHIRTVASTSFKQTKVGAKKQQKNNPWFNWQARSAKRELRKATNVTSRFPSSDQIREEFYRVKGNYKRLLKKKRK